MKRNMGRYVVTVGAGMGLLAGLLLTSGGGKGKWVSPAWGESTALLDSGLTPHDTINDWPATAKKVAGVMLEEYGQPNIISESSLVWFGHGAWKRTVVYRDGWQDQSSILHPEVLEQVVTYKMPQDRENDLALFDSRIGVDSATHELAFRSDSEKMNYLAINLADEIVARWKTVAEAKAYALKATRLAEEGKDSEYTKGFLFQVQNEYDAIPD